MHFARGFAMHAALLRGLLLAAIFAWGGASPAMGQRGKDIVLAWRFDQNREMTYKVRERMTQTNEGSNPFEARWDREFVYTDAVEEVSPRGDATIRRTFDEVRVKVDHSEQGKRDYDSARKPGRDGTRKDENDPLIRPFSVLVGKSFTFTVTPEGRVTKVEGYADIMGQVLSQTLLGDGGLGAALGSLAAGSDEDYRRQIEQSFAILPGRAPKRGESWTIDVDQPIGPFGTVRQNATHTRTGATRIQTRGSFVFEANPELAASLGQLFKITFKEASVKGTSEFDPDLGLLRASTMETRFEIDATLMSPDGTPARSKQVIEQKATMELVSG